MNWRYDVAWSSDEAAMVATFLFLGQRHAGLMRWPQALGS